MASLASTQSRVRVGSIPASTTVIRVSDPASVACASSSWPSTRTSLGRWLNWRMLTEPVASVTALGSIEVTRSIGTKTRRRVVSSTTSPRIRGGWASRRRPATRSRTRPMDSPSGPKTGNPDS